MFNNWYIEVLIFMTVLSIVIDLFSKINENEKKVSDFYNAVIKQEDNYETLIDEFYNSYNFLGIGKTILRWILIWWLSWLIFYVLN